MLKINQHILSEITKNPDWFKAVRVVPWNVDFNTRYWVEDRGEPKIAILDFETSGLDYKEHDAIELGIFKCIITPTKSIQPISYLHQLNQPTEPLTKDNMQYHCWKNKDLKGKKFNTKEVYEYLEDVSYIVSHKADFDRPFFHKHFPAMTPVKWGCTLHDIDWKALGVTRAQLVDLLADMDYTFDAHKAITDVGALAFFLYHNLELGKELLYNINADRYEILAWEAPYKVKDALKERDYRFDYNARKVWSKVISESEIEEESEFLINLYEDAEEEADVETLPNAFERYLPEEFLP